jgi:hypothetical protein
MMGDTWSDMLSIGAIILIAAFCVGFGWGIGNKAYNDIRDALARRKDRP